MKNMKFIFAALVSLAALSCQKDSLPQSTPETDSEANKIPLILRTGDETKTSLQADGAIHWSSTDKLAVFDNSIAGDNNNKFTATYVNGSSAEFSGSVGTTTSYIAVVYPYELAISAELTNSMNIVGQLDRKYKLKVRVPDHQTAKPGTFADAHNISVSKASVTQGEVAEARISFKNVCALLSFTLPENLPAKIDKVTIFSNTAIAGEMDVDYKGDTPSCSISNNQLSEITMTGDFKEGETYWFVVAPVKLNGLTIAVHAENNMVYRKSTHAEVQLTQGKYRSLGTLKFDGMTSPELSAKHTYGDSGESEILTGTKLTVTLPHDNIKTVNLKVYNSAGTEVRHIQDLPDATTGLITSGINAGWPYLPTGNYTVTGDYTTSDNVTHAITKIPFEISEIPTPRRITDFDVYTSYTNKDNNLDGESIYVEFKVNVADGILNGTQYSDLFNYDLNGRTSNVSLTGGKLKGVLVNQERKEYNFTSFSCSFDGSTDNVIDETDHTVHVTGIPEKITLYKNENGAKNSDWSLTNVEWSNSKCCIFYGETDWSSAKKTNGYMVSPKFYIPKDSEIGVSCSYGVQYYTALISGSSSYKADIKVGLTSSQSVVSDSPTSHQLSGSNETGESFTNFSDSFVLTPEQCYISFYHNSPDRPRSTCAKWYVNMRNVSIEYSK